MAECPSSSIPLLWSMPFEQQPPLAHCMPTYLPYVFFEDSRSSVYIQPVSVFLAVVLTLWVVWLELEAWVCLAPKTDELD